MPTGYIIAGKAHEPKMGDCQVLGDFLVNAAADVTVKYVVKDASEWAEFVDSVCRSYGFAKKSCPLIYTVDGDLIGDHKQFVDHVRETFGKYFTVFKETQRGRVKLNIEETELRMRKQKAGETLVEKIDNHLEKLKKKQVSQ